MNKLLHLIFDRLGLHELVALGAFCTTVLVWGAVLKSLYGWQTLG